MKYYTLQIKLNSGETHEFKDIDEVGFQFIKSTIWVRGVKIQTAPMTWELICPLRINEAIIIEQDKKFAP